MHLCAMAFVLLCSAIAFGGSHVFPQGEKWLADWQVSMKPASPIVPPIVLIRAEERSVSHVGKVNGIFMFCNPC